MQIVILAAGQGKRMHSALPKVLQPLAGAPLLAHVLRSAQALQPRLCCVVIGHGGQAVQAAFSDQTLCFATQTEQKGTGHAVQQALPQLNEAEPTLVLYGDVPLIKAKTLQRLIDIAQGGLAVLTAKTSMPTGYGRIVRNSAGDLLRIVEEKDASPQERAITEVNTGILVAPTSQLKNWLGRLNNNNAQGEYYLTDIIGLAVQDGLAVQSLCVEDFNETLGVNNKMQLAQIERLFQAEQAQALMAAGVTLIDPARIDIRGSLECGKDVSIDLNCIFEGHVRLKDNVQIGANCVLRNVTIESGTCVAPFSHLESSNIGENCVIGPYARTRPGTTLKNGVHVGNFVEIKNSTIGTQSKANHLSYIGDSDVGARVNIGAGTITCNYDGVNKHKTIIEDDAFIGSDTQLIAPVRVGQGATIGAGTTLAKDAPAQQLTVSRAKQISLQGWSRPVKIKPTQT